MGLLSSGDQPLRLLKWSGGEQYFEYVSQSKNLSTFLSVEILSSGNRLLKCLKWPGEEQISPVFALIYRNGNSSSLAKEQAWLSRLLHFPKCFPY